MAYLTGLVTSDSDLRTALFNGVSANGWSVTGDVIHKGDLYFKITLDTLVGGLMIQGGTGISGGALIDPSPATPRCGKFIAKETPNIWPSPYFLMIHSDPDEVYLWHRFGVDTYTWLSFGKSSMNRGGTGAWFSARAFKPASYDYAGSWQPCNMKEDSGGVAPSYSYYYPAPPGAMFWFTSVVASLPLSPQYQCENVHVDWGDGPKWLRSDEFNAVQTAVPHLKLLPSAWNMESVLLPIQALAGRGESKNSLVIDLAHARFVRIDNHDPEQIISIGHERWKIFPWVRKYLPLRGGPGYSNNWAESGGSHSGTLGIAIRYDGA